MKRPGGIANIRAAYDRPRYLSDDAWNRHVHHRPSKDPNEQSTAREWERLYIEARATLLREMKELDDDK